MTPLVAVIIVVAVLAVGINVVGRARAGRRSVRSHHRALDTLGHITNQQPGRDTTRPGAAAARQAHVRVVSADAEALPAPRPLTGGWRPTRATGAAPFRKPPPQARHDLWADPDAAPRWSDAAAPETVSAPSPVEQVRVVTEIDETPEVDETPAGADTDTVGDWSQPPEPEGTWASVEDPGPRIDESIPAPPVAEPWPAYGDHADLLDDAVARAWHDDLPTADAGGNGDAGSNDADGDHGDSASADTGPTPVVDGDTASHGGDRSLHDTGSIVVPTMNSDPESSDPESGEVDDGRVAASFDDVSPGATPVHRRPLGAPAGHRQGASPARPGRTDLAALASVPAAGRSGSSRASRSHRRRPSRVTVAISTTIAVIVVIGVALLVVRHGDSSPTATRPPATHHHAAPAPPTATTTPTTLPPVRLISSTAGTSLYQVADTAQITVRSAGPCWIEIRRGDATGALVYSETMASGTVETVTGPVWVRLGNPTVVDVTVNGAHVSPPVTQGEPYDLQFQ